MQEGGKKDDVSKDPMAGTDYVVSILLMVLCSVLFFWSLELERPAGWASAPGLIPLFLAISTFFMSLGLLVSSMKRGGISRRAKAWSGVSLRELLGSTKVKRSLWIILLTAFYMFVLLDRMLFELSTFLYLLASLRTFWRKGGWLTIILISILTPFLLAAIFRLFFSVLMPGDSLYELLSVYIYKHLQ